MRAARSTPRRSNVPRFGASFGGQTFGATLSVATPISDLAFKASANGKVNLGAIKEIYPLDEGMSLNGIVTANVSAAGRMSQIEKQEFDKMQTSGSIGVENMAVTLASLPPITIDSASANITPKSASLDRLNVRVGASDIAAKGSLTNYWGYILHDTTLAGRLTVTSSLIDANELMAAMTSEETAEEKPAEEQPAEAESAAEAAPAGVIEVPKNLDLTLDSTFGKVLFEKMVIENLKGVITVKNGAMSARQTRHGPVQRQGVGVCAILDGECEISQGFARRVVCGGFVQDHVSAVGVDAADCTDFREYRRYVHDETRGGDVARRR